MRKNRKINLVFHYNKMSNKEITKNMIKFSDKNYFFSKDYKNIY